ncbi:MAG: hypothetical protein F6K47_34730, partial [Symploca sp. SIO2E6]|nr:hypothetical protein [Symploca sp. SIO2E6]
MTTTTTKLFASTKQSHAHEVVLALSSSATLPTKATKVITDPTFNPVLDCSKADEIDLKTTPIAELKAQ